MTSTSKSTNSIRFFTGNDRNLHLSFEIHFFILEKESVYT